MTSRRSLNQGRVGDQVLRIFEDREIDAGFLDEFGDVGLGLVGVGVDPQDHDALFRELVIELDQPGHVET